jgi:hypothetical protein
MFGVDHSRLDLSASYGYSKGQFTHQILSTFQDDYLQKALIVLFEFCLDFLGDRVVVFCFYINCVYVLRFGILLFVSSLLEGDSW